MSQKQEVGKLGEDLAFEFLRKKGYTIIERNFRARYAELDIIALDHGTLVIIEVKTRSSNAFGAASEAISRHKLESLIRSTEIYLASHPTLPRAIRIDLVAITLLQGQKSQIEHIANVTL